jgi:hypothetical protein
VITCPICQHENPDGAEYCEDCGASLEPASAGAVQAADPAPDTGPAPEAAMSDPALATSTSGQTSPLDTGTAPAALDAELPAAEASAADSAPAAVDAPAAPPAAAPAEAPAPAEPPPAPGAAGDQRPRLIPVRHGAPVGGDIPLMGDRLLVGRFDTETGPVDVDLSDVPEAEQISRHHAEIYREADGTWYVQDLGSTNGVFVKSAGSTRFGPRLTAPQALSNGDELAFGNSRFLFQIG